MFHRGNSMSELLKMENICKVYPNGVVANRDINFSLKKGEIHALVGENGAGKSTLMKILFGLESMSEGKIIYKDKELLLKSPMDAISQGIGMVHQHFMLVSSVTIAENIVLGMEPRNGVLIDKKEAFKITKALADKYHFDIDPAQKIEDASVGTKQKVEILKALFRGAQILILDEPTAVLTPQETEELFKELKLLKEIGHTIVFISHKLNEVKEICDRITVMRRGRDEGTFEVANITKEEISNLMVGKTMEWKIEKGVAKPKESILQVRGVSVFGIHDKKVLNDVSFVLRAGEILGIVAVEGNGQSELVDAITGMNPYQEGDIILAEQSIRNKKVKEIRDGGMAHIPEDRMSVGISKSASIRDNMLAVSYAGREFSKYGLLNDKKIDQWAKEKIKEYQVLTTSEKTEIGSLSGGNIQKVVVAREFSSNAKVIVANQPTRGIDVGAAKFIHRKLVSLRDEGAAVLLVSADLTEVMDVSDSLLVLYEGEIVAYFADAKQTTENELGLYMLGLKRQEKAQIREVCHE